MDKHPAFSMLEIMFAVVAISVFLAAFTPVITNQYAASLESIQNNGMLLTAQDCEINFKNDYGLKCTLCYGEVSCVTCGGDCPAGKVKNKEKCDCI